MSAFPASPALPSRSLAKLTLEYPLVLAPALVVFIAWQIEAFHDPVSIVDCLIGNDIIRHP